MIKRFPTSPKPVAIHPLRRGFTLVEMIATIVILGVMGSIASNILLTATDAYVDAAGRSQLTNELSMTMDRLVREFRQIDLDDNAASEIGPDINSVTASSITWHTNYSVSLSSGTLQLVENGGSARPLLQGVTAFSITAYDQGNTALAASISGDACDDIRRLRITITASRLGTSATLRSKVFIRSTMVGGATDS